MINKNIKQFLKKGGSGLFVIVVSIAVVGVLSTSSLNYFGTTTKSAAKNGVGQVSNGTHQTVNRITSSSNTSDGSGGDSTNGSGGTTNSGTSGENPCSHTHTTIINASSSYTGDTVCNSCGRTIAYGETIENSPTLISFTLDGKDYQAEANMTWQQWVNSSYNDGNWIIKFNGLTNKKGEPGLYDNPSASSIIIANNEYFVYMEVLSFTIDDSTYQFLINMTWEEWVNSKYNVDNYTVGSSYVHLGTGVYVVDAGLNPVKFTDQIVAYHDYYLD